ncbi:hypothetical protein PVK06_007805 [Gossypium arboreum]|uniref:Uncharacterized protein n=1 Tax=Gossypium arboreum TaxID=29729 RepID=A0ABR0QJQ2_GOSAR|nr:hypothetical protein PVK06_007805 [Gossypium arboreum]
MDQVHTCKKLVFDILAERLKMSEILQTNILIEKLLKSWSDDRNLLKYKKRDISLEELISHMKIEEVNCLKDKALVTSSEFHLKANLVEYGFGPKFNWFKTTKNSKKNAKLQNKRVINFKKSEKNKSNNSMNCYMCGKV